MLRSFCLCCQSTTDVSWSTFREVIVRDSKKLYFARLFQSVIVVFAIFFAFISIFALHTSTRAIVHFFTSWRWAVIRSFELQKRISDTIQRVFESSSRRKFHIRSTVIVRRCFQWRRNKWLFTSIHSVDFFWSLAILRFIASFFLLQFKSRSLSKHLFDSLFFRHFHLFRLFIFDLFYLFLFFFLHHSFRQYHYIVFILSIDVFNIFFFSTRTSSCHDTVLSILCAVVSRRCLVNTSITLSLCSAFSISFQRCQNNQKKWCLLSVISHMLAVTSNYQFDYLESLHSHQKAFIIMKFSADCSLFFDFCLSYDSNSRSFEWKVLTYSFNRYVIQSDSLH